MQTCDACGKDIIVGPYIRLTVFGDYEFRDDIYCSPKCMIEDTEAWNQPGAMSHLSKEWSD